MLKKLINYFIGIILLPFVAGFAVEFFRILEKVRYGFEIHQFLVYGFVAYIVLHIIFHKPIMTYVFAHEFTHALWTLPFGGRLQDFHVGRSGGHAVVTQSNIWVAIAPYFFPLFSYVALGIYGIFISFGVKKEVFPYICFLVGFTLAFHLIFTGYSLARKQSDLKKGGILLSLALIVPLNMVFIVLILKALDSDGIQFVEFLKDSVDYSVAFILKIANMG